MNFTLKVWRQKNANSEGSLREYPARNIPAEASFLEMLDIVNDVLLLQGEEPIAFDHDCREGICGSCSLVINGVAHGPNRGTTCQVYMRNFQENDTIFIEPFRGKAFKILKDLVVDRQSLDRIIQAGGYISARAGSAPDANSVPIAKEDVDLAMDAAACISCGACVAACPNSSAMLFTAAKVSHLGLLPQGQPERKRRAIKMVQQMDDEGFGNCSNHYECEAVCPAAIPATFISRLNREYAFASIAAAAVGVK